MSYITQTYIPCMLFILAISLGLTVQQPALAKEATQSEQEEKKKKLSSEEKNASRQKIEVILSRQEGEVLKVYMKKATGLYINGTSCTDAELPKVVRKSKLENAAISYEAIVPKDRIAAVLQLLKRAGIKNVTVTKYKVPRYKGGKS